MLLADESVPSDQVQSELPKVDSKRRRIGPGDPASIAFRESFSLGGTFFLDNEHRVREGEARGVHQLRTTSRRLRSLLDLFEPLGDPEWNRALDAELKWLSAGLGRVRDLDVLTSRFQCEAEAIDSIAILEPLFEKLASRRRDAAIALAELLESDRYRDLLTRLSEAPTRAPLTESADDVCEKVLPRLVLSTWKSLRKSGRQLTIQDPDESFHDVRKRAKRARYAAEAVSDALDHDNRREAKNFARKARLAQDVLGEHQDAVVAAAALRDIAEEFPSLGRFGLAAGRLLEREIRAAESGKARYFEVFPGLDRKKMVRWLYP